VSARKELESLEDHVLKRVFAGIETCDPAGMAMPVNEI
jgi:hypothetical protein